LGAQTYSAELLALLDHPAVGNASIVLATQLIAARLHIANGTDGSPIQAVIATANQRLSPFAGKLPYLVNPASPVGQQMVWIATALAQFNDNCESGGGPGTAPRPVSTMLGGRPSAPASLPGTGGGGGRDLAENAARLVTAMSLVIAVLLVVLLRKTLRGKSPDE
jgi:hypothetical protein